MKNKKIIALIIGFICFAFSVFGIFKAINTSFFEIPVVKLVIDATNMDMDEIDEILDEIDGATRGEKKEFKKETGIEWEELEDCIENPSINSVLGMLKDIEESNFDIDYDVDLNQVIQVLEIVRIILIVYGAIIALFSLLGALFGKKIFPIIAMIISLVFYLAFVGIIFYVLFLVFSVAQIILMIKPKNTSQITPAV